MLLSRSTCVTVAGRRPNLGPVRPGGPARAALAPRAALAGLPAVPEAATGDSAAVTRRAFFAVAAGAGLLLAAPPARSSDAPEEVKTFLGYAEQPDLYLGQGYTMAMNYKDAPKYSFKYPATWEEMPVSKTDKSTMGMDGLVVNPKSKRTKAFVIALGGKDYAEARLIDAKRTLLAMTVGDPDLRDAVTNATDMRADKKVIDGVETYCYEIPGDKAHYLAKVGIKDGTVFGLFATSPASTWASNEPGLRQIYDTFKML